MSTSRKRDVQCQNCAHFCFDATSQSYVKNPRSATQGPCGKGAMNGRSLVVFNERYCSEFTPVYNYDGERAKQICFEAQPSPSDWLVNSAQEAIKSLDLEKHWSPVREAVRVIVNALHTKVIIGGRLHYVRAMVVNDDGVEKTLINWEWRHITTSGPGQIVPVTLVVWWG